MYHRIMVPVDLAHLDRLTKALATAADMAKHYDAPVCFVGVTPELPTEVAHTPEEYNRKLKDFGAEQADKHDIKVAIATYVSHDPSVDLHDKLIDAIGETRSDLVVMASHIPGFPEHIFSSNAGAVASHAEVSVFVVR